MSSTSAPPLVTPPPSLLPEGIYDEPFIQLETIINRLGQLDLTRLLVCLFDIVEASALPHLVDQFDLGDYVTETTPEDAVRALLKQAIALRRRSGTPWAVRQAILACGVEAELVEWWQAQPQATPNTFSVHVSLNDNMGDNGDGTRHTVLTPERLAALQRFIRASKRASQTCDFTLGASFDDALGVAVGGSILTWRSLPADSLAETTMVPDQITCAAGASVVACARRLMQPVCVTADPAAPLAVAAAAGASARAVVTLETDVE